MLSLNCVGLYLNFMFSPFKKNVFMRMVELTGDVMPLNPQGCQELLSSSLHWNNLTMELPNKALQKGVMFLLN